MLEENITANTILHINIKLESSREDPEREEYSITKNASRDNKPQDTAATHIFQKHKESHTY